MERQNVSATLDRNLLSRLDELAEETERKRSWLINRAIESYLEEVEDMKVAKSRLSDERLSPSVFKKAVGV